jgi:acetylornithine/succinyldiaminopimelate/putrescine aminotransferase
MPAIDDILRRGFDDFREHINPQIALRTELTGEPFRVVRAHDGRMVTAEGDEIEDLHGTQAFGHRNPAIAAALRAFLDSDACNWFPARVNPFAGRLARVLADRTGYDRAYLAHSGTEGVEAALKLARGVTRRPRILGLDRAYHGCTFGSVALMPPGVFRDPFAPHLPGVEAIPLGDVDALSRALATDDVAAVIVEPIQLEGGVRILPSGYIDKLANLTHEHGSLLIADEVQTGMGRTGHLLLSETWPRRPDAVILGKALGGGLVPCSAMLTSKALFDKAYGQDFESAEAHNNTFSGHALSAVAALAALELLDDALLQRARRVGDTFRENLRAALADLPLVRDVRGVGLIVGLEFAPLDHPWLSFEHFGLPEHAGKPTTGLVLCHRLYKRGFFCFVCGHDWSTLRLQPRLTIEPERLDAFVRAAREEVATLCDLV